MKFTVVFLWKEIFKNQPGTQNVTKPHSVGSCAHITWAFASITLTFHIKHKKMGWEKKHYSGFVFSLYAIALPAQFLLEPGPSVQQTLPYILEPTKSESANPGAQSLISQAFASMLNALNSKLS